jgi:hypothetical protein
MKRLCTYIVTEDTGFAPNPFGEWCTLAACTPNHMSAQLNEGDRIVGFLSKSRQNKFLFAMEILSVMQMGDYFTDPRFESKKPQKSSDWRERCGDNIYEQLADGTWVQHENYSHTTRAEKRQDTKHPKVFIASKFWYCGKDSLVVPAQYAPLIPGRGIRCNHSPDLVEQFMRWVAESPQGVRADPNDIREMKLVPLTREHSN